MPPTGRSVMTRFQLCEISIQMRDVLIDHVDGSCPYVTAAGVRNSSTIALMRRGYISFLPGLSGHQMPTHPKETFITYEGRRVLAIILADAAEVLVRAGQFVADHQGVPQKPQPPATASSAPNPGARHG